MTFSVENPELTHDVNVNGTLKVLLAAKNTELSALFSSSSSTYGGTEPGNLLKRRCDGKNPVQSIRPA